MGLRDDFCITVLSHGRPERVLTYKRLRKSGYTGPIVIVLDDEDPTAPQYRENYPDAEIVVFSKAEVAERCDGGDNTEERRSVLFARNASFDIARKLGYRYFLQLDDDTTALSFRCLWGGPHVLIEDFDAVCNLFVELLETAPVHSVAMSQGGDWAGGLPPSRAGGPMLAKRKVMNSFFCDTERRFEFVGKLNDDVNTYLTNGLRGMIFGTVAITQLDQKPTQSSPGGLTEYYLEAGTYAKSFFSVMYAPSCVKVSSLLDREGGEARVHHRISWNNAAPMIVPESFRKPDP